MLMLLIHRLRSGEKGVFHVARILENRMKRVGLRDIAIQSLILDNQSLHGFVFEKTLKRIKKTKRIGIERELGETYVSSTLAQSGLPMSVHDSYTTWQRQLVDDILRPLPLYLSFR